MFNRWDIEVKHGLHCDYSYGRNGTDKLTGRIQSVDSRSSFARAYGAQVKLTDGLTIGADAISRTWRDAPKPRPVPRNGAPLGMLQWQTRVNDVYHMVTLCKMEQSAELDYVQKHIRTELARKWGNRAVYSVYLQGYVQGLIDAKREYITRELTEFCYVQNGVLFSTHKQSTHRLTEEFYSAGKGRELGNLPNGIYWRGSDKPYFVKGA